MGSRRLTGDGDSGRELGGLGGMLARPLGSEPLVPSCRDAGWEVAGWLGWEDMGSCGPDASSSTPDILTISTELSASTESPPVHQTGLTGLSAFTEFPPARWTGLIVAYVA